MNVRGDHMPLSITKFAHHYCHTRHHIHQHTSWTRLHRVSFGDLSLELHRRVYHSAFATIASFTMKLRPGDLWRHLRHEYFLPGLNLNRQTPDEAMKELKYRTISTSKRSLYTSQMTY
jgi:hypothetical protein